MEGLVRDLLYALRLFRKNPGFALLAVLTLGVGIGANSAIFSAVNGVLLNPLPYKKPDRLMWVTGRAPKGFTGAAISGPDFVDYRDQNRSFEHFSSLFLLGAASQSWSVNGHARQLKGAMVSSDFFETLGYSPVVGRSLARTDEQTKDPQAVVLTYHLWQEMFGGRAETVGTTARLDGNVVNIVGVMPASLDFPKDVDLWYPIPMQAASLQRRNARMLFAIGRLRDGVSQSQAQNDLNSVALHLQEQFPAIDKGWSLHIRTMQEAIVGSSRPILVVLFGAVGFVLLIACVNVSNLLLARYGARQHEISIRTALGAGRFRMLSQFMAESLLLAVISGAVALLLAYFGIELLRSFGPASLPRLREVRLDNHVLGFTAAISMLTTLLFGLAPAWFATSSMSAAALREGARAGTSCHRHSLGRALVVAETAMSICLLTGAGLLIVSLYRTLHTSPGFQVKNLVSTEIMLPKSADAEHRRQIIDQTLRAVRVLPGVEAAGAISEMPIHNETNDTTFDIAEHPSSNPQDRYDEDFRRVTPGYFQAMHIPLMRGRLITDSDMISSAPVAVIDEPFARRYFHGEDPVGKHIRLQEPIEIVGVVGGVRNHSLRMEPQPTIYLPFAQQQSDNLHLVVRSSADPAALSESVQQTVASADPDAALSGFETMQQFIDSSLSDAFFDTLLLGLFAALALVLAMAGVYGVFSHIVTAQTREIGIRMALGAQRGQILNRVLVRGLALAAFGATLGLAAAFFLTNVLASQLYEINARNPFIFVSSTAILICVAILACSVPARRAMKVDPMVALRHE